MSVAVIKSITQRIRKRYGSTEAAAAAAGVVPSAWSGYENADKPDTTIPLGRLLSMSLTSDEKRAIAGLFGCDDDETGCVMDEASEATEAAANVLKMVRMARQPDGSIAETDARPIRAAALEAKAQMNDVLKAVS